MHKSSVPYPTSAFAYMYQMESTYWWFRARNQIILWAMAKHIPKLERYMEVGCGTGYVLQGVRDAYPTAHLTGTEYSEEGLVFARQRIPDAHFIQLDATKMELAGLFDVVGTFDVLEHIEQDEEALQRIYKSLEPGGFLVVTVPQHKFLWSAADSFVHHVRRYTKKELVQKMQRAGFEVAYTNSFVALLFPFMWLSRLIKKKNYQQEDEFQLSPSLNTLLFKIMKWELVLLKMGIPFPFGGSLLVIGQKIN